MDLSQILSSAEVQAFASGFPVTVVHLIVTLGLFAGAAAIYLAYAAALFLLMALPGFLLMRQSKQA